MTAGANGNPGEGDQRRPSFARPFLNRGSAQLGTAQIGNGSASDPMVRAYAEISATLHVPIGVAKVLVGDLIVDGVLQLYDAPTDVTQDLSLVRELIDGIRNL
jgi:hypothetical protein